MSARPSRFNSLFARLLVGSCLPLILFLTVGLVATSVLVQWLKAQAGEQRSNQVIILAYKQQHHLQQMSQAVQFLPLIDVAVVKPRYDTNRREFRAANLQAEELVNDIQPQAQRLHDLRAQEADWNRLIEENLPTKPPRINVQPMPPGIGQKSQTYADQLLKNVGHFIEAEEAQLNERRAQTANLTVRSFWTIGGSLIVSVLLMIVFVWQFTRSLTRPIDDLQEAGKELLAGHYRLVQPTGPDEIAQLIVHFNHLGFSLAERTSSLQEQHEGYRQYLGATSQLLWRTNAVGEIDTELPSWQQYTGMTAGAVRGWGWLAAVHPDDRARTMELWSKAVADHTIFETECRLRSAAGAYGFFTCRGVPIVNADGSVREWIGTCADITERVENAKLQKEKEAAETVSRTKTEFLTKMSHELRTPLNAVIGMSKLLLTQRFGRLNAKQADYLNDVEQAGEHLLALINDILDLAKVEAGRMEFHAERFSLNDLLTAVVSTLRPLADAKGLRLRLAPAPTDGTLATDSARLKQVLYNLLSNAIKFTPEGEVTVLCQWTDNVESGTAADEATATAIRVVVCDTGIGIATEDQPHIWDEFARPASSRTLITGQEGTGLGLALTRTLVQRLGGTVWVESHIGEGSTFGFVIPRQLPVEPPAAESLAEDTNPTRPLALIVEDYPPTNKLLVDWLTGAGMKTISAFDGEAGLALAHDRHPQLLILDLNLPKLNGWQLLTELKQDTTTATIPIVVVTEKDLTDDERQRLTGRNVAALNKYRLTPEKLEEQLTALGNLHASAEVGA